MIIYLYVKKCTHCGKLYFGRTKSKNPYKYPGSGKHWGKHIKKHSAKIETIKLWKFTDQERCTRFALRFSHFYKIHINKDIWFNWIPEDGKYQGLSKGSFLAFNVETQKYQITHEEQFKNNPLLIGVNKDKKWTEEQKEIRSKLYSGKGNPNYGKPSRQLSMYNKETKRKWVTNGYEDHLAPLDEAQKYIESGFWVGRTQSNNKGKSPKKKYLV